MTGATAAGLSGLVIVTIICIVGHLFFRSMDRKREASESPEFEFREDGRKTFLLLNGVDISCQVESVDLVSDGSTVRVGVSPIGEVSFEVDEESALRIRDWLER